MANEHVGIDVDVDTGDSAVALQEVANALKKVGREADQAAPDVMIFESAVDEAGDTAKRTAAYAALAERNIKKLGNESLKTAAKMTVLAKANARLMKVSALFGGGGKGKKPIGKGGVAGGALIAMASRFGAIAYVIASVIPALVTGIVALGAGIIGLAGALAPLAGLLVAYPGYLAAVGQGFIAVKLALMGATEAMKAWGDATLSEQKRNAQIGMFTGGGIAKGATLPFLRNLSMIKTEFTYIGYAIKWAVLPAMTDFLKMGRSYLPMIQHYLVQTGGAIAGVVNSLGSYLGSGRGRDLVSTLFGNNVALVRTFGNAVPAAVSALLEVVVAAGPVLKRMAADMSSFFTRLGSAAATGGRNGGLATFFESAYQSMERVKAVIFPLLQGLWNIMRIGKPLGDAMLDSWGKMADKFRDFTQSASGVQKISQWFAYMMPIVYELGYLIRDLAIGLGKMSMNDGFLQMAVIVRTQLLPVLLNFINSTSEQFFPVLLKATQAILELLTAWQGASATAVILDTIANALLLVANLTKMWGGFLKQVLGVIFAVWAAIKIGGFVTAMFTAIVNGARFLVTAFQQIRVAATYGAAGINLLTASVRAFLMSTVIGAILVGLSMLATALMSTNDEVDAATEANKQWADSLFNAAGALDATAAAATADKLAKEGMFEIGKQLGIGQKDLTDAVLGQGDAYDRVIKPLQAYLDAETARVNAIRDPRSRAAAMMWLKSNDEQYVAISKLLGVINPMTREYGAAAQRAKDAAIGAGTYASETQRAAAATERLNTALQILKGLLDDSDARIQQANNLRALVKATKASKGSFKETTVKGGQAAAARNTFVRGVMGRVDDALAAKNKPKAIRIISTALEQANTAADKLGGKAGTAMKKSLDPLEAKLLEIRASLNVLTNQEWRIPVSVGMNGYVPNVPTAKNPKNRPGNAGGRNYDMSWRFAGGDVAAGRKYMVGELGPEGFLGADGRLSIVGKNGPEVKRFSSSGYIIPNHALADATASTSAGIASAVAAATRISPGQHTGSGGIQEAHIHIGTINAQTEFDVVQAVKRGLREAERDRRERG